MPVESKIEVSEILNDKLPLWDAFVKDSPQGNFFYSSGWLNMVSEITGRPLKIWTAGKADSIRAGIVIFENSKYSYKMATPVYYQNFNGPVFYKPDDEKSQKTIANHHELLKHLVTILNENYDYFTIDTHFSNLDLREFLWQDFQFCPKYTYLFNLNTKDIDETFNQSLRKKVKQATESGFEVVKENNIEKFIELYDTSYNRHKMNPPVGLVELKKFLNKIIEFDETDLHFVKLKNDYLSARLTIKDATTVYDFLAGSFDKTGLASSFLVYHLLKLYSTDYSEFDFLGANHPEIEKFKRSFGGELKLGFQLRSKAKFPLSALIRIREHHHLLKRKL